ncbi:MAG: hypothetical protein ACLQPN_12275 [Bryobacteraceae bacterium]
MALAIPAWAQNACDLVTTGATPTQSDITAAINMSIGSTPCTANIMGANVCNVVVVQRVINAYLGQPCIVGTHSVVLTWSASTAGTYPIQGYNVYRSPTNNPYQWTQINPALITTGLTFTDAAVSNSVTYYYAVTAVDTQNNQSAYSTPATANIPSS